MALSANEWAAQRARGGSGGGASSTSGANAWASRLAQAKGYNDDYFKRKTELQKKDRERRKLAERYRDRFFENTVPESRPSLLESLAKAAEKGNDEAAYKLQAIAEDERINEQAPAGGSFAPDYSLLENVSRGAAGLFEATQIPRFVERTGEKFGPMVRGKADDAPSVRQRQQMTQQAKRELPQDQQQQISALDANHMRGLLDMVQDGASREEIQQVIDETNERQRQQRLQDLGTGVSVASLPIAGGGLRAAFQGGGGRAVARSLATTVGGGAVGGAGYELAENPDATGMDIAKSAGIGGAGAGLLSVAAVPAGAALRGAGRTIGRGVGIRQPQGAPRRVSAMSREITQPGDARSLIRAHTEELAEELSQRDLTKGRISQADTPLTAALTLDRNARREGVGPLGRMMMTNLERISNRNKLTKTLTESFLGNARVNRGFLRRHDEELFELGEQISRSELVKSSPEQLAKKYNTAPAVIQTLKAGRVHYDEMLELANNARRLRGDDLIKPRENYVPHLVEIADKSDFGRMGTGKRPFFEKQRTGEASKKSYVEALDSYQGALANDVYMTPTIREGRVAVEQLREQGNEKGAEFFERWLRESITKQDVPSLRVAGTELKLTRGGKTERVLQKINQVRAISALTLNFRYLTTTLPASIVQLGAEAGLPSTIRGASRYMLSKNARQEFAKASRVGAAKRSQGIGVTAGGQLDYSKSALMKGKVQKTQEVLTVPNEILENFMTGIAYSSGKVKGRQMGLKGRQLDDFADYVTGISQEIYNPEFRAEILRNIGTRSAFPFQTFVVGQWNRLRRFSGTGGGVPLAKRERLAQATTLLVGTALYNQFAEWQGQGSVTTAGSFVPFVGGEVDRQLRDRAGADTLSGTQLASGGFDRPATAPQGDIENIQKAVEDYIENDDWVRLRREALKWGGGLAGIGGGGQVAKTIEGIETMIHGESRRPSGEVRFTVEQDAPNLLRAVTSGQYATREGQEYTRGLDTQSELQRQIEQTLPTEQITINQTRLSEQMKERTSGMDDSEAINAAKQMASEHNAQVEGLLQQVRQSNAPYKDSLIKRLEDMKASEKDYALKQRLGL